MVQVRAPLQAPVTTTTFQQGQTTFTVSSVVTLPPGTGLYDLPPPARLPAYGFEYKLQISAVTTPAGRQVYDRPQPPPYYCDWSINLLQTTLKPAGQKPFAQYDWPLPQIAQRIDENIVLSLTYLYGKDVLPHTQYDWPVPPRVIWYQDYSQNLLLTTLFVSPGFPHNQYDWSLPRQPFRPDFSFLQDVVPNSNMILQMAPNIEWNLYPDRSLTDGWLWSWIYYSQFAPTIMAPNADWPYPERVTWYQDWNTNGYALLKLVKPPFFNQDWQLPQRVTWYQDWNTNGFALYRSSGPIPKSTDGSIPIRTMRDLQWDWTWYLTPFIPMIPLGISPNMEWNLTDAPANQYRDYSFNGVIRYFIPPVQPQLHFKPIQTNEGRTGNLGGLS